MMLVEEIERLHVDLWHARQDAAKKAEIQRDESEGSRRQLGLALSGVSVLFVAEVLAKRLARRPLLASV
jgi:TPP-dependent indolepyruvate ferredoxin oxidoreductase alpha subunit